MIATRYPDLDLDLSFHPLSCAGRAFTGDLIDHYNEFGYMQPITMFPHSSLASMLQRFIETDPAETRPLNPHARLGWVFDIIADSRLLHFVGDVLGENIICIVSQYIDKPPGSGTAVAGHQDAPYFAMNACDSFKAWLALEDADTGNGCMWFCPGSHKLGALPVRDPTGDLNLVDDVREDVIRRCGKIPMKVKAGQVVFFSTLLVHLSPPNPSADRYRRALTMDYTRAEVAPHEHALAKHSPVLCSGQDASGLWSLLPRPKSGK